MKIKLVFHSKGLQLMLLDDLKVKHWDDLAEIVHENHRIIWF